MCAGVERGCALGPRVTPTTVASLSTPACIFFRASPFLLKWSCFAARVTTGALALGAVVAVREATRVPLRKELPGLHVSLKRGQKLKVKNIKADDTVEDVEMGLVGQPGGSAVPSTYKHIEP
jgi:hypothetical protein